MKIIVENEQEKQVIVNVCDAALKFGGVRIFNEVGVMTNSIVMNQSKTEPKPDDKKETE